MKRAQTVFFQLPFGDGEEAIDENRLPQRRSANECVIDASGGGGAATPDPPLVGLTPFLVGAVTREDARRPRRLLIRWFLAFLPHFFRSAVRLPRRFARPDPLYAPTRYRSSDDRSFP